MTARLNRGASRAKRHDAIPAVTRSWATREQARLAVARARVDRALDDVELLACRDTEPLRGLPLDVEFAAARDHLTEVTATFMALDTQRLVSA